MDPKALVETFMACMAREGFDAARARYGTPGMTWWAPGMGEIQDRFAEISGALRNEVAEARPMVFTGFTVGDDRVAVEAESWMKLRSGAVYRNQYHFLFELAGGKVAAVKEYNDTRHRDEVVGHLLQGSIPPEEARPAGQRHALRRAWAKLCDTLAAEGERVLGDAALDDVTLAEGLRAVLRHAIFALELRVEFSDTERPRFFRYCDDRTNWGAPNAQNTYLGLSVRGDRSYKVRARTYGRQIAVGNLWSTRESFAVEDDGSFEITLSSERPASGNWFPLGRQMDAADFNPPEALDPLDLYAGFPGLAGHVMFKTYYEDWEDGLPPAEFQVECLDPDVPLLPPPLDAATMADRIGSAADILARAPRFWDDYLEKVRAACGVNRFSPPMLTPVEEAKPGVASDSPLIYGMTWFQLQDGEGLLIESELPSKGYWSFQLYGRWYDAGDFQDRQTSLNHLQSHVDADGRFRGVIAPVDPGIPNWLDSGGHRQGMVMYRWINSDTRPVPEARVVPLADLPALLPASHPRTSEDARRAQILRRRKHFASRFQR